jgi:GT2 family glycosyltransferase
LVAQLALHLQRSTAARIPLILFHTPSPPRHDSLDAADELDVRGNLKLVSVSIIIPTRDKREFLEPCIRSIWENTDYPTDQYELIIIDNGSTEASMQSFLDELLRKGVRVIRSDGPFNYARLNNLGAAEARGEILVLLNNDVVVKDPLWLHYLVAHAQRSDAGAVGARLLYPDGTTQHGGVVLGIQGVAAHAHHNIREDDRGYYNLAAISHEVSAVTGACLAIRASLFRELNGMDEQLAVAFNDTLLCLSAAKRGFRNIYIGKALLFHHESRSRGLDDKPDKIALFRREAIYARRSNADYFRDDPFYNPNLSLEKTYELAFPPRVSKPWYSRRRRAGSKRIMLLSQTHEVGHGVATVLGIQARYLAKIGYVVFVAGPRAAREINYEGCQRIHCTTAHGAAIAAFDNGIDCIIAHTPPFYSVARWLGNETRMIAFDHGEPDPDFFPDAEARRRIVFEKQFCARMADKIAAISYAVRAETGDPTATVIPNCNDHLVTWSDAFLDRRLEVRRTNGWSNKFVALSVCRFHERERLYKGVDIYAEVLKAVRRRHIGESDIIFVQCGKGNEPDRLAVGAMGLSVFSNVPPETLSDLYSAADCYMSFSKWEGYNLGIGEALAMGLPVIASDIPAHRAFGIFTSNDLEAVVGEVIRIRANLSEINGVNRVPKVWKWEESLEQLRLLIEELCATGHSG